MQPRNLCWLASAIGLVSSCALPDDFHDVPAQGTGGVGGSGVSVFSTNPAGAAGDGEVSCDGDAGCGDEPDPCDEDLDDDGYLACLDCDDTNDAIRIDAIEIVDDGVDQDCDGAELCYRDEDGDGARTAEAVATSDLECGDVSAALPIDCDDSDACVGPSELEYCNAVDDDCDGRVDEACRPLLSSGPHQTCALGLDDSAQCWGDVSYAEPEEFAHEFSTISATYDSACAVTRDLDAVCWGEPASDISSVPEGPFTAISAGEFHACALRPYRRVECWGDNGLGQGTAPAELFDAVSVGRLHTCGLRNDGAIECWGNQNDGAAGLHAGPFVNVSVGSEHSCGVRLDGSVECWGENNRGQTEAEPGEYLTVSAGRYHTCALRKDHAVVCWGDDSEGQSSAPPGEFAAVSVGVAHTCALDFEGQVECWGSNVDGQRDPPPGPFARGESCGPAVDPNQLGPLTTSDLYLVPPCSPNCESEADWIKDWGSVASFDYLIPDDNEVFDVTVHGTWGYPVISESSGPAQVFVEGVLVATCEEDAACWDQLDGTLVDWSFSFRQAEVPDFESLFRDGHAELSVQQLGRWVVALHDISLTVFTRPAGSDTGD